MVLEITGPRSSAGRVDISTVELPSIELEIRPGLRAIRDIGRVRWGLWRRRILRPPRLPTAVESTDVVQPPVATIAVEALPLGACAEPRVAVSGPTALVLGVLHRVLNVLDLLDRVTGYLHGSSILVYRLFNDLILRVKVHGYFGFRSGVVVVLVHGSSGGKLVDHETSCFIDIETLGRGYGYAVTLVRFFREARYFNGFVLLLVVLFNRLLHLWTVLLYGGRWQGFVGYGVALFNGLDRRARGYDVHEIGLRNSLRIGELRWGLAQAIELAVLLEQAFDVVESVRVLSYFLQPLAASFLVKTLRG